MNISNQHDENSLSEFSYQSALPISNGRLAMLLFVSTEIMMFAAILASCIVLRYSGDQGWPTAEQVQLNRTLGWVNTGILMLSGICMWISVRRCANQQASDSKTWLMATLLLGLAFLGVKGVEYKAKYDHGLFPNRERSLVYNAADEDFLSRAVSEMRKEIKRVERIAAAGQLDKKNQRLEDLYLLQSGIVDWTQSVVGRTGDPAIKRDAIAALAHQIFRHEDDPSVTRYIESESARISEEKIRLQNRLSELNTARGDAQQSLQDLLPKKDSGKREIAREYDRLAEQVSRLTDQVTQINQELRPVADRLQAVDRADSGSGINATYDIRLPVVIPGGHKWASLYYLLTGAHALHLIGGLFVMLFLLGVRLNRNWLPTLENLSLYWHFVDVVWLVVFAVIYLT